jgi:hypothetical protein
MPMKLREHREAIAVSSDAYSYEVDHKIDRLCRTLIPHLRAAGYHRLSTSRHHASLAQVVRMLFGAQDWRPMFHVEGTELPLCWNAPKDWDKKYIKYEWGHLTSRNQDGPHAHRLDNLALYSARCNQHIQTSMNIQELMVYGGIIAQRISNVLTNRRRLFASEEWQTCVLDLGEPRR